ncbi:cysteine--tRNA ligase [bacterium]|nr:cysteine--tRNA ligase [bacterium]
MRLYNTLTRQLEEIEADNGEVRIYSCGPTVYLRMHIGNIRAYVSWDVLHRALLYLDYKVNRIMNFTDVGHMNSDEDWGEDKVDITAKKTGKDPIQIADYYIETVLKDFTDFNILAPSGDPVNSDISVANVHKYNWTRATEYVDEMIEFVALLEEKGYTYGTGQAIYFDVQKYSGYSKLFGQKLSEKKIAVRDEVKEDPDKKHPADFVLWMKNVGKYADHAMKWESPWGVGFPGWHIECSAMGVKRLGTDIHIHTGGVDHISVHHTNERAQNYGAYGKEVVRMWVHNEFLQTDLGDKISKSKGHEIYLEDFQALGYEAMDLRFLLALNNYQVPLKFSSEALKNARNSRLSLISKLNALKDKAESKGKVLEDYKAKFSKALHDNLNVSVAYGVLNEVLKSEASPEDILETVLDFDRVFGFQLESALESEIPEQVMELVGQREEVRKSKDFTKADQLRVEIEKLGYTVLDSANGPQINKKAN